MKTSQWITRLVACGAIAASGSVFADVGLIDGQSDFSGLHSTKSRAEVRDDLTAARSNGSLSNGDVETWSASDSNIGARGPAGSRYSMRTRDDVRSDLTEYQRSNTEKTPSDIYFPN
jgi:hypothetical protein